MKPNEFRNCCLVPFHSLRFFVVLLLGALVWGAPVTLTAQTVTHGTGTVTVTPSGAQLSVYSALAADPPTYHDRIWVYTRTAAQIAQGVNANPPYPYGFTAVPVQRFGDTGGAGTSGTILLTSPGSGGDIYILIARFTSSNGAYFSHSAQAISFPLLTQTVTLSPNGGAASITNGQTFSGTASGAQAGNPYNISIVSGPGAAAINSSTGAYTIIANGAGTIVYKVWISAGGGYDRSADVQPTITASVSKQVVVTIPANKGAFPIEHKLVDAVTGVQVPGTSTMTQMPGDGAYIITVNVPSGNDVKLASRVIGAAQDDNGNWFIDENAITDLSPSPNITPQNPNPNTPAVVVTPTNSTGTPAKERKRPGVVWSSGSGNMDPTQQVDLLTNATYKEGVQNIIDGMTMVDEQEEAKSTIDAAAVDGLSDMHQAAADATALANEMSDVFEERQWVPVETPSISPSNSPQTYRVIGLNGQPTSFNFSLNMFNNPKLPAWLPELMSLARLIIAATALGMLYLSINRKVREAVLGVLQISREGEFYIERKTARMAQSIPWAGGFIGQLAGATLRLSVYAIFIAMLLTMPAVLITLLDNMNTMGWESYKEELQNIMANGGTLGYILSSAVIVVPIPTLLAVFATRMVSETLMNMSILPIGFYIRMFKL